ITFTIDDVFNNFFEFGFSVITNTFFSSTFTSPENVLNNAYLNHCGAIITKNPIKKYNISTFGGSSAHP
ncbi:hypothetical protein I5R18_RS23850, partial [Escherichia coli]